MAYRVGDVVVMWVVMVAGAVCGGQDQNRQDEGDQIKSNQIR
jgi:hypothetical protein